MSNPTRSSTSPVRASTDKSRSSKDQKRYWGKRIKTDDFKGLIVPVLACFKEDETNTLDTDNIDKYAAWIKREQVQGICINTITGEGPALGVVERRVQLEEWWKAAYKYDLLTIVQIGAAPLHDVLQLAEHAEELRVHAVLCLPELFFKPTTLEELLGYCKIVAAKCPTRPFLYYHIPALTGVDFDMLAFCNMAEKAITNFVGLLYSSADLEMGSRCLRPGRVVILGSSMLLASGILLGFETYMCSFLTVRPDFGRAILSAMNSNNPKLASTRQQQLNEIIHVNRSRCETKQWVDTIKYWFNAEMTSSRGPRFVAGPIRSYCLKKTI